MSIDFKPTSYEFSEPLNMTLNDAYKIGVEDALLYAHNVINNISDELCEAQRNEDWQTIAHIAIDVMPRVFEK